MLKIKHITLTFVAALLAACGGSGDNTIVGGGGSGTGGTPGGGGTSVSAASISVTASEATMPADGSAAVTITAYVRDEDNALLGGVPVAFTASSGGISPGQAQTSSGGAATAELITAGDASLRTITVTVQTGDLEATVDVEVVTSGGGGGGGGATAASITASSSATSIPSDGSASATITAYVRDANNTLIGGVPVSFSASSGGVSSQSTVTGADGRITAELITAGDATLRTITVTATAGALEATVDVQVIAPTTSTTVQMGSGTGPGFMPGVMEVSNASLSAGGSTSLSVSLVQSDGSLYTGSVDIGFNSPCVATGTSEIRQNGVAVSSVTTTTGIATVTYVAQGCSGSDVITASAVVGSATLSASGTVTVAAAAVGSIEYVSATPTNIALQGTGSALRPETSTVVFRVKDSSNGAVSGAEVSFALNSTVGGTALSTATATSDSQGFVQTIVEAGTVATSVVVTATVVNSSPAISTQSAQLTITTGIPTDASFSLAVECFNIEGWDYDGITTAVTARLGDRFQNPVPDGTAITFTAEGGNILSQCLTSTSDSEGGVCSVDFRSSNPRPADGRVTVFAKAIGEESFTDANGNGAYDNGETFSDIPEPFRDDNEDGVYDAGEDFFDFNSNFARDVGDGLFNGVLCNATDGTCGAPSTRSTGIGEQNLVILSGSSADISLGQAEPVAIGGAAEVDFWVRDLNGNVMPAGTTVALTATTGYTIVQPGSFTVPCTAIAAGVQFPGLTEFNFLVQRQATTTAAGVVTLTVTTPAGLVTRYSVAVEPPPP